MIAAGLPAAAQSSDSGSSDHKDRKETSHKSKSHGSDSGSSKSNSKSSGSESSSGQNKSGHSAKSSPTEKGTKGATAGVSTPIGSPDQNLVLGTKPNAVTPEPPSKTLDSPMQAVGGAWKMLVYLVPILLIVIGGLALLRHFHERTGSLPLPLQAMARRLSGGMPTIASGAASSPSKNTGHGILTALLGSFTKSTSARNRAESSIRVLESTPVGGANLHLIEVRGRVLLLGVTGMTISVLTDFDASEDHPVTERADTDRFRDLLESASLDMDDLDFSGEELPAVAVVASMEDRLRGTSDALEQRVQRLRSTRETESNRDTSQDGESYV